MSPSFRRSRSSDWYRRAEELSSLGDFERALPFAERAVSEDPQRWRNWCSLSRALEGLWRYEDALRAAQRALALEPEAEWAHRLRSRALTGLGQRTEALQAAREAVAIQPNEPRTWGQLSQTAAHLGFAAEAQKAARRAVELDPDNADRWVTLSFACLGIDWDEARRASERALQLKPEYSAALNNLGWVHLAQGRPHEARDFFDRAIRIAPGNTRHLFNRAIATNFIEGLEVGAGEYRRAAEQQLARTERRIAENPHDATAHTDRAYLLRRLETDPNAGLNSARRAVSLNSHFAYGWTMLIEIAGAAGRWQLARYAARRAIEVDPSTPDGWGRAAEVALRAGRPAEARRWANRIVTEAADSRAFLEARSLICFANGDFEEALTLARQDIAHASRMSCCRRVFAAACCIELGNEREAREALEQAELLRPACGCFRRQRVLRLLRIIDE